MLQVFFHVLDHDDRVIDHQPDRQDEAAQGERVDREAESRHHRKRRHERDRDRQHGNHRGAHALQKDEDDDEHEQKRFEERVLDFFDILLHILGRVVNDAVLEARRKAPGQVVHVFAHLADDLEPIGIGVLIDRERARQACRSTSRPVS